MTSRLRIVIADDERPARSILRAILARHADVEVVGEAANGSEAVELIERLRPDLALLDLQMPEVTGLDVVRLVRRERLPLVAFVTAYDQYAVRAFELNAVDYLLKPVDPARLRETINRAQERLERAEDRGSALSGLRAVAEDLGARDSAPLARIPVRRRNEIVLVPVEQIAAIVADGELLHLYTAKREKHTISYRLRDLEPRLAAAEFVRLSRGTLANLQMIERVVPMPGGTYTVTLANGQELPVSRIQSRILRDRLLRL
jgi:two-component system LytT family response regulator